MIQGPCAPFGRNAVHKTGNNAEVGKMYASETAAQKPGGRLTQKQLLVVQIDIQHPLENM